MSIAAVVFMLSLAAWAGVGYLLSVVLNERGALEASMQAASGVEQKQLSAAGIHDIARTVRGDRALLAAFLDTDIVRFASFIEGIAKQQHLPLSIAGALADTSVASPLSGAVITIEGSGSFSALFRAATILETLPSPTSLQYVEFVRNADPKNGGAWRMTSRIRLISRAASQ